MSSDKKYVFKSLQTYASKEKMADAKYNYRSVFDSIEMSFIGANLSIYNTEFFEADWQTEVKFVCTMESPDKSTKLFSSSKMTTIRNDENIVEISEEWNPGDKYLWEKGTYKWAVYFDDVLVGECNFYIEFEGLVTATNNPYFELRNIKLYKGGKDEVPFENRVYLNTFNRNDSRYIWVQLEIKSKCVNDWFAELFFNYTDETGMLKESISTFNYFEGGNEDERFLLSAGWGAEKPGYWLDDKYILNIVFMDTLIAKVAIDFGDEDIEGEVINLQEFELKLVTPNMSDETGDEGYAPDPPETENKENIKNQESIDTLSKLDELIGLKDIKTQIHEFSQYIDFVNLRKKAGFPEEKDDLCLHSVFTGNPGTGKTTVVKLLGKILKEKGLLSKGHVHEVDRASIVAEYIGQTAPLTKKAIKKARGGILFIDEAYTLVRDNEKDFGIEALEVILKEMTEGPGDIAIMAAGYPKEMEKFLNSNPGLKSRMKYYFHFEDYTPDELTEISKYTANKKGLIISEGALKELRKVIIKAYRSRDHRFGNARYANYLLEQAKLKMGIRILSSKHPEKLSKEALSKIVEDDIRKIIEESEKKELSLPVNEELLNKSLTNLNNLQGLDKVKQEVNELVKLVRYYREIGENVLNKFSFHSVYTGNPGTGKTTVARIIGNIYKALGILERGHVIETDREGLVAEYVGQTAPKTKKRIEEAMDGILFIDEAYALSRSTNGSSYGQEAIEVILREMENRRGRLIVIVAGYTANMAEFIDSNPGLQSRFDRVLEFDDYDEMELFEIAEKMLNTEKMYLDPEAGNYLANYIKHLIACKSKNFGNAREIRKLVNEIIRNQNLRMADLPAEKRNEEALHTITLDDVDEFVVKPIIKRPVVGYNSYKL